MPLVIATSMAEVDATLPDGVDTLTIMGSLVMGDPAITTVCNVSMHLGLIKSLCVFKGPSCAHP